MQCSPHMHRLWRPVHLYHFPRCQKKHNAFLCVSLLGDCSIRETVIDVLQFNGTDFNTKRLTVDKTLTSSLDFPSSSSSPLLSESVCGSLQPPTEMLRPFLQQVINCASRLWVWHRFCTSKNSVEDNIFTSSLDFTIVDHYLAGMQDSSTILK